MSAAPASSETSQSPERGRDFDVFRLRFGHAVALLAAFALLFIMAGDWYSTVTGEEAREIVNRQGTDELGAGPFDDGAVQDARIEAEQAERNAWGIDSVLDFLVLLALLATIGMTIAAAALRAAGREPPDRRRSPIALAAYLALLSLVLVIVQAAARLDPDTEVTIEIGLPLGVAALGALACGAALVLREDQREADAPGARSDAPGPGRTAAPEDGTGTAGAGAYNRAP